MSCELTGGYTLGCADNIGGIKSVHLARLKNVDAYTEASGSITALTQVASTNFYKFELEKENGMFQEVQTKSVADSTNFYEGTLTFSVNSLVVAVRNNLSMLALSPLFIIIEDMNGNYFAMGCENGADLTTSTSSTGTAFGDKSGNELTFVSKEKNKFFHVDSAVVDGLTVG